MISISRIRPEDVDRYRRLRLRALEDTPSAFATTLEEAKRFPDEVWHGRVAAASTGPDSTLYLAVDSGGVLPLGLDHMQTTRCFRRLVQLDVRSSSRHVGGDRDATPLTGARDDLRLVPLTGAPLPSAMRIE